MLLGCFRSYCVVFLQNFPLRVYIEGSLKTDKWQDKEGNERYSTGVVANNYGGVQILGGGENSLDSSSGMNQEPTKKENLDQTVEDDDLPF